MLELLDLPSGLSVWISAKQSGKVHLLLLTCSYLHKQWKDRVAVSDEGWEDKALLTTNQKRPNIHQIFGFERKERGKSFGPKVFYWFIIYRSRDNGNIVLHPVELLLCVWCLSTMCVLRDLYSQFLKEMIIQPGIAKANLGLSREDVTMEDHVSLFLCLCQVWSRPRPPISIRWTSVLDWSK